MNEKLSGLNRHHAGKEAKGGQRQAEVAAFLQPRVRRLCFAGEQ